MLKLFRQRPETDFSSLGNLLLEEGMVTEEQLMTALQTQGDQDMLLGEALVHMGVISYTQLDAMLARQKMHRDGRDGIRGFAQTATDQISTVSAKADALLARLEEKKAI